MYVKQSLVAGFEIGYNVLDAERHATSQVILHFPTGIDSNPSGGEAANVNHQGAATVELRMLIVDHPGLASHS